MALEPRDQRGRMYHVGLKKGDVGKVVFLPGDPARVEAIAKRLEGARLVAEHREYKSYSGYLGREKVLVTSTGIGGPSTAIAVEELARLGARTMVRVGTCGSISERAKVGDLVIADSAVRLDGTTAQYVTPGYPAAASPELVLALKEAAERLKKKAVVGISASTDSFYVGQGRKGFGGYSPSVVGSLEDDLRAAKVLCFEMECSTLFTLGRIYGLKTAAVLAVVADRLSNEFRVGAGVDDSIDVAVGSLRLFKKFGV